MRANRFTGVLVVAIQLACSGGSKSSPPSAVGVTLDQSVATVTVLRQRTFVATVSGSSNASVTWSVAEGDGGGTVDAGGSYTAPATPGTYHLVAKSVADPSRSATAAVTVLAAPSITSFAADRSEVLPGAPVTLTADFADGTALLNPGMQGVTSGTPVTVHPADSTVYVLTVTNAAGTAVAAGVAVTVSGQVAVGVLPATARVEQGTTLRFGAVVSGTTDGAVIWSVLEGAAGGAVAADGTYTPPNRGGTFHVVATSLLDPSRSSSATVTVPRAWQPPIVVSSEDPFVGGTYPVLRGNDAGDLLVAWIQGGDLMTRFYSGAAASWDATQVLGPAIDFTLGNLAPTGTSCVLYQQGQELRARVWSGATWGAEELVQTLPVYITNVSGLSVAWDPGQTALATWLWYGPGTIWAAGRKDGAWTAPQGLTAIGGAAASPRATLRPGDGWVAWMESDRFSTAFYAARWTGAALGATAPLTTVPAAGYPYPFSGPALGMRDDGTAWVTYQQLPSFDGAPDAWVSTFTGGGWTSALLETATGGVQWSGVPNRGARALRLWTQEAGAGFAIVADRQSISPFLSPPAAGDLAADVSTSGKAVLAWQETGNADVPNRYVAVVYDHAALEWGARTVIATFGSSYFSPSAAVADDGRAAVAWSATPTGSLSAKVQVRHYR